VEKGKIVSLEDRIPKLKQQRRKKANKRLIILLFFFFLLIGCIIYFQSPLSHIKNIVVKGNSLFTDNELIEMSGLTNKTNLWKVDEEGLEKKLLNVPEIRSASVKVRFPNTVTINISEHRRIAYVSSDASFAPVMENGTILKKMKSGKYPVNAPILINFNKEKVLKEMINGLKDLPGGIVNSISEIHYTPKDSDDYRVTLYMNDGFQVVATLSNFSEKMAHYPSIISQLDPKKKGIIDLEVGSYFKAFEQEGAETEVEKEVDTEGEG
jgi:cell division protein FtsQ